MLLRRLERRGYSVVHAADGEQAVAMAQSETPDLILMDMNLPVLDGWEATRVIKADAGAHTPLSPWVAAPGIGYVLPLRTSYGVASTRR